MHRRVGGGRQRAEPGTRQGSGRVATLQALSPAGPRAPQQGTLVKHILPRRQIAEECDKGNIITLRRFRQRLADAPEWELSVRPGQEGHLGSRGGAGKCGFRTNTCTSSPTPLLFPLRTQRRHTHKHARALPQQAVRDLLLLHQLRDQLVMPTGDGNAVSFWDLYE